MKIVVCLLVFTISPCFAGLFGSPAITPQDNSIHSVPSGAYYGNYGVGRLALKYSPTPTRGYSAHVSPYYMRLAAGTGAGKIIANGMITPTPVPFSLTNPYSAYSAHISNPSKILRFTARPTSSVDPYRASSYMGGGKILGILPSNSPAFSNYNSLANPSIKVVRVVQSPSVYNAPAAVQPMIEPEMIHRGHYHVPKVYHGPTINAHAPVSAAVYPNMNPSAQVYTAPNYGSGGITITGMSGLSPEVANAIMKILNEPSSAPQVHASAGPIAVEPDNQYIPGPTPIVATNEIDHAPSGTANDIHVVKHYNPGLAYTNNQPFIPPHLRNVKLENIMQIYGDEDAINAFKNYQQIKEHQHQLHQQLQSQQHQFHQPPPSPPSPTYPNHHHNIHNSHSHQQQEQQNLPSSFNEDDNAIPSQTQSEFSNDVSSGGNNSASESEAQILQQLIGQK